MYVIATNTYGGEYYLTNQPSQSRWSRKLTHAILYEYVAEIPPLESDFEYIIKVECNKDGELFKVHKN